MRINFKGKPLSVNLLNASDMRDNHGLYLPDKRKIYISKALGTKKRASILMHELTHHAIEIAGLTGIIGEELEEKICNAMEIYGKILIDNRGLLEEIIKGE